MTDPTPEEIREACLAIQATWSEAECRQRASGLTGGGIVTGDGSLAAPRWLPPAVRVSTQGGKA